jgi:hypothetical protein
MHQCISIPNCGGDTVIYHHDPKLAEGRQGRFTGFGKN